MRFDMEMERRPTQIGPYSIVRRLGAGGMAEAFEGVRRGPGEFEQRVCVKRVLPQYSTHPDLVRLFRREARIAASLSHRNIARVVEFGEDRGVPYLALEMVEGLDLRRLLQVMPAPRRLPADLAALIGVEIAEALDHAHTRAGKMGLVVHRDVSPANILLSTDGDVKLTDFGISKARSDCLRTRSEFVRGNLWYMAPEQREGTGRPDPRSDLFSLGVVLYQCLAGRRPYRGVTDLAAMMELAEGRRLRPLREAAPEVDEGLAAVIDQLLECRPDARPQSAGEVAEALLPFMRPPASRRALRELVLDRRNAPVPRRPALAIVPTQTTVDLPKGPKARPAPFGAPDAVASRRAAARPGPRTLPLAVVAPPEGPRTARQHRRRAAPLPNQSTFETTGRARSGAPVAAVPVAAVPVAAVPAAPSSMPAPMLAGLGVAVLTVSAASTFCLLWLAGA